MFRRRSSVRSPGRIFIHIAAYRDSELLPTMRDALVMADRPNLLSFGVCWQAIPGVDDEWIAGVEGIQNVRMIKANACQSRGVGWARSQITSLWVDEELTLQIDSHTRFVRGWDRLLKAMLAKCPTQSLLTCYLPAYTPPRTLHASVVGSLAADDFDDNGMLGFRSRFILSPLGRPQEGAFLSGHFLFGPSRFWRECPYDPHIYFKGEEASMAARAFTHGWRLFYPNRVAAYHAYTRKGCPRQWDDDPNWWRIDSAAQQRVRVLLGMETADVDLSVFGLGQRRTLEEYERFAGVDFRRRLIGEAGRNGVVTNGFKAPGIRRWLPSVFARLRPQ
jgi:hypothetical protein